MKVKTTIEFLEPDKDGVLRKTKASFISEQQYTDWLKFGAGPSRTLVKEPLDTTVEAIREHVLTLEDAAVAAADTHSFLLLESPTNFASAEDVNKLKAAINNRARAIEVKTTRSIGSNAVVKDKYGDLQLINHGESVKFYFKGDENAFLECDGLIKTSVSALLNEVKASPKEADLKDVLSRASKLELILTDPSRFVSDPPPALEELIGVKRVVPFLSGCDFSRALVNECSLQRINAVETNGSDYSVSLHLSPDS
jgi:hypothetical protein